ncbi:MAG: PilZ domain-containing protein, partial [Syntrophomonadaceae bacterium]|nr:PilZ domain-containing protein [Syntrophomonadaceae bacterium]
MAGINYQDFIKINKLIEIEIDIDKRNPEQKEVFASRVEDLRRDAIVVAAPYKRGTLVPVPVGEEVLIRIGKDGTYHLFHTKVAARIAGHQPVLNLSLPFKVTKIQMRNWVRVDTNLPMLFRPAGSESDFIETTVIDISGGGICMLNGEAIAKDTLLEMEIIFPDKFILKINGTVTRNLDENKPVKIGVCFQEINERDQERIVGYVFKKQREHIRKGVGQTPS